MNQDLQNNLFSIPDKTPQSSYLLKSLLEPDVVPPLRVKDEPKRKKRKKLAPITNSSSAWQALVRHAEHSQRLADEVEALKNKQATREKLTQDYVRRLNYLQQLFDSGGNQR